LKIRYWMMTEEAETLPSDRKARGGQTSCSKPDDDPKGNSHVPPRARLHMLSDNGREDVYSSVCHFIMLNSLLLFKSWAHYFPLGCFSVPKTIFHVNYIFPTHLVKCQVNSSLLLIFH
jgi:hypothetical protein